MVPGRRPLTISQDCADRVKSVLGNSLLHHGCFPRDVSSLAEFRLEWAEWASWMRWPSSVLLLLLLSCFSRVRLRATPETAAHQAPPSLGFSRPEYWSGEPFPSPGDLPSPGIEPRSPALQVDSLLSEPPGKSKNTGVFLDIVLNQGPALQADSLPTELSRQQLVFLFLTRNEIF